jgi:hypothetical protein
VDSKALGLILITAEPFGSDYFENKVLLCAEAGLDHHPSILSFLHGSDVRHVPPFPVFIQ